MRRTFTVAVRSKYKCGREEILLTRALHLPFFLGTATDSIAWAPRHDSRCPVLNASTIQALFRHSRIFRAGVRGVAVERRPGRDFSSEDSSEDRCVSRMWYHD